MADVLNPSIPSSTVTQMQDRAKVCNTLMGGTMAMRNAGVTYLPQEAAESDVAYKARLNKTVLFAAYKRSILTMVGKPFETPIIVGEDVPAKIEAIFENVDLAGRDLDTFARDSFQQNIIDGIGWVLVDYPQVERIKAALAKESLTLEDETIWGVRPYLVHIPLSDVLGWRTEVVQGVHCLTMFRFFENVEVPDGMFGTKTVKRVRVWEPGQVTVYIPNPNGEGWIMDDENSGPVTIQQIPVVTFYTGRLGYMLAEPPLEDLAWLNVEHWQSRSDQRNILHVARVPLLFGKNIETDQQGKIVLGPNRLIKTTSSEGDLKWVEIMGGSIGAGQTDLEHIEDCMSRMAGEVVARVSGDKTATETNKEDQEGASQLRKWVWTFKDAMEEVLRFMALWIGEKDGGSIVVNTEWDDSELASDMILALNTAVVSGNLSKESFLWNLKREGKLPPDRSLDDEKALIKEEAPPPGVIGGANPAIKDPALSATDRVKARADAMKKVGGEPPADGGGK